MTCHRVPMSPSLCTCGAVLDITVWHGDDELGNPLCPTCSGCGCEPNERNERVSVPTDTPSTDGAPDPEEVLIGVLADMFEPWEPASPRTIAFSKMLRETMCVAQGVVSRSPDTDVNRRMEHVKRIERVIQWCDRHRPIGPDGKHGTRQCTPTCGCEDKREPITPVEPAVEPDTTSDTLDFDAMPVGTVIRDKWGDLLLRREGGWFEGDDDCFLNADDGPFTVVYQPAPVSPAEGLRAVMAGRDDADELIEYASKHWNYVDESDAVCIVLGAVGDAARSGGAT